MTRLTKAARDALPDSDFMGPNRTFPVPPGDKDHERAAIMLSGHAANPAAIRRKARGQVTGRARAKIVAHRRGM